MIIHYPTQINSDMAIYTSIIPTYSYMLDISLSLPPCLLLQRLLPILDMIRYHPSRLIRCEISPNRLDEITFWICTQQMSVNRISLPTKATRQKHTHQIKINAMIHQIILTGLHTRGRTKIHTVRFTRVLDLFVRARQADEIWVELREVLLEDGGCVARRVAGDHEGEQHGAAFGGDFVVHEGHFVEFVRADVRAVGEAEVHLIFFNHISGVVWMW